MGRQPRFTAPSAARAARRHGECDAGPDSDYHGHTGNNTQAERYRDDAPRKVEGDAVGHDHHGRKVQVTIRQQLLTPQPFSGNSGGRAYTDKITTRWQIERGREVHQVTGPPTSCRRPSPAGSESAKHQ